MKNAKEILAFASDKSRFLARAAFTMMLICTALVVQAQGIKVDGHVVDVKGEGLIGATVAVKGQPTTATVTDFDGNFSLSVPSDKSVLVVSYVGMKTKDVKVAKGGGKPLEITLEDDVNMLEEAVVVGFGQQKKASVVGAITQTTGKVLERAGGVSDIGAALTGNLPGVVTTQSSGMPGEEEPQIVIRGGTSWNNNSPLVLVDGVERPMSSVDISSVASISVLKDASATAVYGVKGANGVILVTTKRGEEGRARITATAQATMKIVSKLPNKYDAYDAMMRRNTAIGNELNATPDSWADILPQSFINHYRGQSTLEEYERYPNVDWQDALFKSTAMAYNANVNVSGGTKLVKYFASVDFHNEGDLFRVYPNNRGYDGGYSYNRLNVRSNLDFNITKTTVFKVNLAGSTGMQKTPYNNTNANSSSDWSVAQQWAGAYNIAPDVFLPVYSDGGWGYYPLATNVSNSAEIISVGGVNKNTITRINTDFTIDQKLDFITKGLSANAMISWDNNFKEWKRGVNDMNNDAQHTWVDPVTGILQHKSPYEQINKFDFAQPVTWATEGGEVQNWSTLRKLRYQAQVNYARKFGQHDVTAMGVFARDEYATGSEIARRREDWAFRVTYNFGGRYFAEYNGAYNGSEKFSSDYRFAFFNSGAIGYTISEEKFWQPIKKYVDMLKFRVSYGEIGDDSYDGRWMYMNQWEYLSDKATSLDVTRGESPYHFYREKSVGNPDIHWETVKKWNYGVDFSFLEGLVRGSVDIFKDKRDDVIIGGAQRAVPVYFGATPVPANLGSVESKGYEIALRFNKVFPNSMRLWADANMTHARNKILVYDDAAMLQAHRKNAGYAIGQTKTYLDKGFITTYDELIGAPKFDTSNDQRLPGDYYIVDFNGDGVVDLNDQAPYGYTGSPENTYNLTLGFDYKGFSCFVQFYGVTNVTRDVTLTDFGGKMNVAFDQGTWWSAAEATTADVPASRWTNNMQGYARGTRYLYDGSFIRLKNAEIAYTFSQKWVKNLGLDGLRVYLNGNNLWMWSRLPDDRESNYSGWGSQGAYPMVKRVNLGMRVNF